MSGSSAPCRPSGSRNGSSSGSPQWWDAAAALVYVTHFVTIPLLTGLVWFRLRHRFREWIAAILTMSLVGIGGYVLYPAAPPWLAAEQGAIGAVDRISAIGWDHLHLDVIGRLAELGQSSSNPVAAMPSLHAGAALLVALFLWPSVSPLSRLVLGAYAVAMAVTLVYTGEHYVVDVLAGWLVAALAATAALAVRSRGRRRDPMGDRRSGGRRPGCHGPGAAARLTAAVTDHRLQCPSDTTSTVPSTTVMAVWSSMA